MKIKSSNKIEIDNRAFEDIAKRIKEDLFDEQSKKIAAYQKQFAHISKVLHEKNLRIEKLVRIVASKEELLSDKYKVIREKNEVIDEITKELAAKSKGSIGGRKRDYVNCVGVNIQHIENFHLTNIIELVGYDNESE